MLKQTAVAAFSLGLLAQTCWGSGPGTTSANFLKAGQGVRPISMGETYVALGDGLDTLYWNPAGLAQLNSPEISLAHNFWFQDIGTEYFAYGTPLGPLGAFGGGITLLHTGSIEQTLEDEFGNYAGTGGQVSALSVAVIGTYAIKLSRWIPGDSVFVKNTMIGANLHLVSESIAAKNVLGGGIDVGMIWRENEEIKIQDPMSEGGINLKSAERDRGLRIGFVAQNLGATTDSTLPIDFRIGAGYVLQEVFLPTGRATLAADVLVPVDNQIKISLGGEYANVSQNTEFALRFGYKMGSEIKDLDPSAGFTAGVGAAIRGGMVKYGLDYAFVPYGVLGATHRIALTLAFLAAENPVRYQASLAADSARSSRRWEPASGRPVSSAAASAPAGKAQTAAALSQPPVAASAAFEAPVDSSAELRQALDRLQSKMSSGLLAGIQFKKGESQFTENSQKTIDQAGRLLEKYPDTPVRVIGFDAENKLSEERAKSVAKYITMTFRVSSDRITTHSGDPAKQPKNTAILFEVTKTGH